MVAIKNWQSQAHVKWDSKYHVVFVQRCRNKVFIGKCRGEIGEILRDLCRQKEIGLLKGNAQPGQIPYDVEHSAHVFGRHDDRIFER